MGIRNGIYVKSNLPVFGLRRNNWTKYLETISEQFQHFAIDLPSKCLFYGHKVGQMLHKKGTIIWEQFLKLDRKHSFEGLNISKITQIRQGIDVGQNGEFFWEQFDHFAIDLPSKCTILWAKTWIWSGNNLGRILAINQGFRLSVAKTWPNIDKLRQIGWEEFVQI